MVDAVLDAMRAQGLPLQDVAPPGLVFTPDHRQLRAAQEGYQLLEGAQFWLPVIVVALVLISLLVARQRLRALAILAGASVVSVALLWPVLGGIRTGALDSVPAADRPLGEAVWDGVTASLERSALVADRHRRGRAARRCGARPAQVRAKRTSSGRWSLLRPGIVRWSRNSIRPERTPLRDACT